MSCQLWGPIHTTRTGDVTKEIILQDQLKQTSEPQEDSVGERGGTKSSETDSHTGLSWGRDGLGVDNGKASGGKPRTGWAMGTELASYTKREVPPDQSRDAACAVERAELAPGLLARHLFTALNLAFLL